MSNELTTTNDQTPSWMQPQKLDEALAMAERLATAKLIPEHLRGDPGSILLVIDAAQRWKMSPMAVAQATSVVRGKLCYEGKLVNAALSSMGAIKGTLDFQYSGPKGTKDRAVTVIGTMPDGEKKQIEGTVREWCTDGANSPWRPGTYDKMLAYRGAREWARIWAPAAMLGVMTADEVSAEHQRQRPVNDAPAFSVPDDAIDTTAERCAPEDHNVTDEVAQDQDQHAALVDVALAKCREAWKSMGKERFTEFAQFHEIDIANMDESLNQFGVDGLEIIIAELNNQ